MPLTMRPTGGQSPVDADRQDWTVLDEGQPVGRIYEDTSASTPDGLRWTWSIATVTERRHTVGVDGGRDKPHAALRNLPPSSSSVRPC